MTEAKLAEIARLKALLAARDGKPGYRANCDEIRARLKALLGG